MYPSRSHIAHLYTKATGELMLNVQVVLQKVREIGLVGHTENSQHAWGPTETNERLYVLRGSLEIWKEVLQCAEERLVKTCRSIQVCPQLVAHDTSTTANYCLGFGRRPPREAEPRGPQIARDARPYRAGSRPGISHQISDIGQPAVGLRWVAPVLPPNPQIQ